MNLHSRSAECRFKLPGITVSVNGTPPQILQTIEKLFKIFPRTYAPADVHLEGHGFNNNNKIDTLLPRWLIVKISEQDIGIEPVMVFGPKKQPATIAVYDGLFFCAWASEQLDQIQFVCNLKKNINTFGLFQSVVIPILREIFLNRGLLLLHSAAVKCPDDTGLLFIAPSGGGKSTSALSLVRKGAKLLGDDLVIIKTTSPRITAFGIPMPVNITNKTMNFFEETKEYYNEGTHNSGHIKRLIQPQQVYGSDCLIDQCYIDVVYFVNITKEGPSVQPLAVKQSMEKLILSHAFSRNQKINAFSVLQVCEILSHVNTFELKTGPNPKILGDWLMDHCYRHSEL